MAQEWWLPAVGFAAGCGLLLLVALDAAANRFGRACVFGTALVALAASIRMLVSMS